MTREDLVYDWNESPELGTVEILDATPAVWPLCPEVPPGSLEARLEIVRAAAGAAVDVVELGDAGDPDVPVLLTEALRLGLRAVVTGREAPGAEVHVRVLPGLDPPALPEGSTMVVAGAGTLHPLELSLRVRQAEAARCRGLLLEDADGALTPAGVRQVVSFARRLTRKPLGWSGSDVGGLGVAGALAAAEAGATLLRGVLLGCGAHTPVDLLAVNLKLGPSPGRPTEGWSAYCDRASRAWGLEVPAAWPVFGRDAFRTATGVHAAAIVKSRRRGDEWLADRVYSGVPAEWFGRRQVIEVGPMSGRSNAVHWLEEQGLAPTEERVAKLMAAAKAADRTLTDLELLVALEDPTPSPSA